MDGDQREGTPSPRMTAAILVLACLVGLALRLTGSDWGLPSLLHPDEPRVMAPVEHMIREGTHDPDDYAAPSHLSMYASLTWSRIVSRVRFGAPITETWEAHRPLYYRVGRIHAAVTGSLAIVAAFALGAERCRRVGLAFAALVAVFPSYVQQGHFARPESPLLLWCLLSVAAVARYSRTSTRLALVLASVAAALAVTDKYPGALTTVMVAGAVAAKHRRDLRQFVRDAALATGTFFVTLALAAPYLLLRFDQVVANLANEARTNHLGGDGLGWLGNAVFYGRCFLHHGGLLLALFALVGALALWRSNRRLLLVGCFGLVYWIALSRVPLHWERWAVPMYVTPLFLAAVGFVESWDRARQRSPPYHLAVGGVGGVIGASLVAHSLVVALSFTLSDTRAVAGRWLESNGLDRDNCVYEGYTPLAPANLVLAFEDLFTVSDDKRAVVLSSYVRGRFVAEPERYPPHVEWYDYVDTLPLLLEVSPCTDYPNHYSLQSFRSDEVSTLSHSLRFLIDHVRGERCLMGPTIRVHALPPRTER